jgi:hypothetical protein
LRDWIPFLSVLVGGLLTFLGGWTAQWMTKRREFALDERRADRTRADAADRRGQLILDVAQDGLRLLGVAAHAVGDEVRATDLLNRAEPMLRDQGWLGLLPHVLRMQVRTELGEWDRAAAAADEGQRLAIETGQPHWSTGTLMCDARLNALQERVQQGLKMAAEAELVANRQCLNDLLCCVQHA